MAKLARPKEWLDLLRMPLALVERTNLKHMAVSRDVDVVLVAVSYVNSGSDVQPTIVKAPRSGAKVQDPHKSWVKMRQKW